LQCGLAVDFRFVLAFSYTPSLQNMLYCKSKLMGFAPHVHSPLVVSNMRGRGPGRSDGGLGVPAVIVDGSISPLHLPVVA